MRFRPCRPVPGVCSPFLLGPPSAAGPVREPRPDPGAGLLFCRYGVAVQKSVEKAVQKAVGYTIGGLAFLVGAGAGLAFLYFIVKWIFF